MFFGRFAVLDVLQIMSPGKHWNTNTRMYTGNRKRMWGWACGMKFEHLYGQKTVYTFTFETFSGSNTICNLYVICNKHIAVTFVAACLTHSYTHTKHIAFDDISNPHSRIITNNMCGCNSSVIIAHTSRPDFYGTRFKKSYMYINDAKIWFSCTAQACPNNLPKKMGSWISVPVFSSHSSEDHKKGHELNGYGLAREHLSRMISFHMARIICG